MTEREASLPKPFGYVRDHDGVIRVFQHSPFSEEEQLMCSTAPVYSHGQMRDAIAASRQQALEEERAAGCLVADALRELLSDTQHKEHADCDDDGWCPVRDGRRALEEFEARLDAIRSLSHPTGGKE